MERTMERVLRDLDNARALRQTAWEAMGYARSLGAHVDEEAARRIVRSAECRIVELRDEYTNLGGIG